MQTKVIETIYDKLFDNTQANMFDLDLKEVFPDSFVDYETGIIHLLNKTWGFTLKLERI